MSFPGPVSQLANPGTSTVTAAGGALNFEPIASDLPILTVRSFPTEPPWKAGDTVTVSAAGDVVPAFVSTNAFPPAAAVALPSEGSGLDRAKDLTIAWNPRESSLPVEASMVVPSVDGQTTIFCRSVAGATSLTISRKLLARLPPTPTPVFGTTGFATISAGRYNRVDFQAGEFATTFWAGTSIAIVNVPLL